MYTFQQLYLSYEVSGEAVSIKTTSPSTRWSNKSQGK